MILVAPNLERAAVALVAPVPPLPNPKVPVTPGVIFALPSKDAVEVLPRLVRIVRAVDSFAALFANHFRLNNLVAVVDHNHMQSMDFCENTLELEDFGAKWRAFGWNVIEINGNSHEELKRAFAKAEEYREAAESGTAGAESVPAAAGNAGAAAHKPTVIIANTVKGYGVRFMENDILWHYRFPHDGWEYDCAVNELHRIRPEGVEDPYTPGGIRDPQLPQEGDDIGNDHTYSYTWFPGYPEKMRRAEARSGSDERVRPV